MGIFDNAKSITFNDKEVKSITVDGGVIYEADEPTGEDVVFTITSIELGEGAIEGASIVLGEFSGTTDSNGKCTISNVPDGEYSYTVSAEGYETYSTTIEIREGARIFSTSLPRTVVTTQ